MLGAYVDLAMLPPIPPTFGHQQAFPAAGWGVLGNDEWGDCALAGPAHETMLFAKLGGRSAPFTTAGVLADYSAVTGFDSHAGPPGANPTDQGSDVRQVAGYRRRTGVVDAHGHRHRIGAYIGLSPGNAAHVDAAAYLFEAVGLGIQFPGSAMDQFNAGRPWDVVAGAAIEGGHYIPYVGRDAQFLYVVTWGRLQAMTPAFFAAYCDEAFAYLSTEMLRGGKTPEGFNLAQLRADLAAVTK